MRKLLTFLKKQNPAVEVSRGLQVDGLRRGMKLGVNPRTHAIQTRSRGSRKRIF
jgi:hypothetical protein